MRAEADRQLELNLNIPYSPTLSTDSISVLIHLPKLRAN